MVIKTPVSNEARSYVRKLLKDHPANKAQKEMMEEALRVPYKENDENTGGVRSSRISNPVEDEYMRVWTNRDFLTMVDEVEAIERVLNKVTDKTSLDIIRQRYFELETIAEGKKRMQSWAKVSMTVKGTTEDTCRKIEKAIVDRIAKELALR
ncbi:hypothetical protein [uncultured Vagococcus sp.]|uniref:hypothetical protein n=1 Tax=uncultured Vagococcus sp. TaxID=189676 RepID=UPI0028D0F0E7|nr:hypothetical protein [uncultured Vagococcus sp.]